ncbi:FAS1 domain-containing protein [Pycnococcus provasolii]
MSLVALSSSGVTPVMAQMVGAVQPSTPWSPGGGFRPNCCCPRWSRGADTVSFTCAWSPCCSGMPDRGFANPFNWIGSWRNRAHFGRRHLLGEDSTTPMMDMMVNMTMGAMAPIMDIVNMTVSPMMNMMNMSMPSMMEGSAAVAPTEPAAVAPTEDSSSSTKGATTTEEEKKECTSIVDAVVATPELSTLLTLVKAANLVDAVMSGNLTVFAPTNDAFANAVKEHFPNATLESLLADPANLPALTDILKYHVVGAPLLSGDVTDDGVASTLLMGANDTAVPVVVTLMDGIANEMIPGAMENSTDKSIYVNDAKVITPDIMTCGSTVAHIIDKVLLPPIILP